MKTNKFFIVLILVLVSNIAFAAGKVTLNIKPPRYDGGERLMIYHIEYMKIGQYRWERIGSTLVPMVDKGDGRFEYANTFYAIQDLLEGERYVFRVKAENYNGIGKPGPESIEVEITREDIYGVRVESGEGLESVKSMNSSVLASDPSVHRVQGEKLLWRKEE